MYIPRISRVLISRKLYFVIYIIGGSTQDRLDSDEQTKFNTNKCIYIYLYKYTLIFSISLVSLINNVMGFSNIKSTDIYLNRQNIFSCGGFVRCMSMRLVRNGTP